MIDFHVSCRGNKYGSIWAIILYISKRKVS